ncbi:hypothetical protein JNW90_25990 [Micromonospora sp. STR1s_5]|nr:hypothetical protein [Micromonospora sp. STR1s_5]
MASIMRPETLNFLEALANSPSPSGFEQPAAKIYRAYTESFADQVRTDVSGNVIAALNPDRAGQGSCSPGTSTKLGSLSITSERMACCISAASAATTT